MLTKNQQEDSEKCGFAAERGDDIDCSNCSCRLCLAYENHFTLGYLLEIQKKLGNTFTESQHKSEFNNFINSNTLLTNTLLELQVEVSELAKATRYFKYWSTKPPESRKKILKKYADVFYMIVYFTNQMGFTQEEIESAYLKRQREGHWTSQE
jgi:dimeric dUTPase (all-alpha-NTP-PPase superfamily)